MGRFETFRCYLGNAYSGHGGSINNRRSGPLGKFSAINAYSDHGGLTIGSVGHQENSYPIVDLHLSLLQVQTNHPNEFYGRRTIPMVAVFFLRLPVLLSWHLDFGWTESTLDSKAYALTMRFWDLSTEPKIVLERSHSLCP
jgi:hypothetical protein